jgi:hypothetical protein
MDLYDTNLEGKVYAGKGANLPFDSYHAKINHSTYSYIWLTTLLHINDQELSQKIKINQMTVS